MGPVNRQLLLAVRPSGMVDVATTSAVETPIPDLGDGQALVQVQYLSIDPTIRTWMDDVPSYRPPIGLGEVVRSIGGGEVVESRSDRYKVGDRVVGMTGWQEYCVADEGLESMSVVPAGLDLPVAMNVLGVTGITAHVGLLKIGAMKEGDVVVVSGAAGATGSMVGQIASLKGASQVVGIAGGPEKCTLLTGTMKFDAAIDYKAGDVARQLLELCPEGMDVYFDNVGGEILEAALADLAMHARVVMCGAISGYNAMERPHGPSNLYNLIVKRARMEGFIVSDHMAEWGAIQAELAGWLLEGKLYHSEHIVEGLDHAPEALNLLFTGSNTGKVLVKVS